LPVCRLRDCQEFSRRWYDPSGVLLKEIAARRIGAAKPEILPQRPDDHGQWFTM
jgi:hypothetical protein